MRYAKIRKMDISNGDGIGCSIFVQGCHFHCKNCFNSETWDFNGGELWNRKLTNTVMSILDDEHITRLSILGGEPLADENIIGVSKLIKETVDKFPDKDIWLWTGNTLDYLLSEENYSRLNNKDVNLYNALLIILNNITYLIDGPYIDELKDSKLKYRGSSNQRVIDMQQTLEQEKIILKE